MRVSLIQGESWWTNNNDCKSASHQPHWGYFEKVQKNSFEEPKSSFDENVRFCTVVKLKLWFFLSKAVIGQLCKSSSTDHSGLLFVHSKYWDMWKQNEETDCNTNDRFALWWNLKSFRYEKLLHVHCAVTHTTLTRNIINNYVADVTAAAAAAAVVAICYILLLELVRYMYVLLLFLLLLKDIWMVALKRVTYW